MIGARHPAAGAASAACYTGRAAHTVVAPVVRCLKVTARRTYRNKSCCTHDHGLTAALLEPSWPAHMQDRTQPRWGRVDCSAQWYASWGEGSRDVQKSLNDAAPWRFAEKVTRKEKEGDAVNRWWIDEKKDTLALREIYLVAMAMATATAMTRERGEKYNLLHEGFPKLGAPHTVVLVCLAQRVGTYI